LHSLSHPPWLDHSNGDCTRRGYLSANTSDQ
jgi:hypothetical protein